MNERQRLFTLHEANALIPALQRSLDEYLRHKEACERLHDYYLMDELIRQREAPAAGSEERLEREAMTLDESAAAMRRVIDSIRSLGCLVRHPEKGIVEFPSERRGERVFLCWRRGESAIRYFRRARTAEFAPDSLELIPSAEEN